MDPEEEVSMLVVVPSLTSIQMTKIQKRSPQQSHYYYRARRETAPRRRMLSVGTGIHGLSERNSPEKVKAAKKAKAKNAYGMRNSNRNESADSSEKKSLPVFGNRIVQTTHTRLDLVERHRDGKEPKQPKQEREVAKNETATA